MSIVFSAVGVLFASLGLIQHLTGGDGDSTLLLSAIYLACGVLHGKLTAIEKLLGGADND